MDPSLGNTSAPQPLSRINLDEVSQQGEMWDYTQADFDSFQDDLRYDRDVTNGRGTDAEVKNAAVTTDATIASNVAIENAVDATVVPAVQVVSDGAVVSDVAVENVTDATVASNVAVENAADATVVPAVRVVSDGAVVSDVAVENVTDATVASNVAVENAADATVVPAVRVVSDGAIVSDVAVENVTDATVVSDAAVEIVIDGAAAAVDAKSRAMDKGGRKRNGAASLKSGDIRGQKRKRGCGESSSPEGSKRNPIIID